ncbi:nickel pincer cofactor biosynthesis protein LarB [Glycomyces paridis]|uniref:Nickel pincer cofactor biosynthesis protein LarB n=1 Tax=Glycomyces paridis TaxID=2126555 RepID=A0A4S8PC59_9ACTN|nr:nickel pincer cofactor biosynthesis protein LarB [Glycomyces paridis]THV27095.1 nickel pincer cofactor biosynthesis protein LarB [Glycomyces paridis]
MQDERRSTAPGDGDAGRGQGAAGQEVGGGDVRVGGVAGATYRDLGWAKIDTGRPERTGAAEAVYAAGKTPEQVVGALRALREAQPGRVALATRCDAACESAVRGAFGDAVLVEAGVCAVGDFPPAEVGPLAVVCAGTSDLPVAREAEFVARANGVEVRLVADVGVAGLHRLLDRVDRLREAACVVVVAGMDGALPSVVAGLVSAPVVAVPTSVGYGAAFGGLAPLLTMLNSCSPGVSVVNIDNGFGAAMAAVRILGVKPGL